MNQKIERLLDEDLSSYLEEGEGVGRAQRVDGDLYRYIEFAKRTFPRST